MNEKKNIRTVFNRFAPRGTGGLVGLVIVAILAFFLGAMFYGGDESTTVTHEHEISSGADKKPTIWTCSMHPQIKLPKPGKCPICFMDLIPLETGIGEETGPRQLRLSETAAQLAQIETTPVIRGYAEKEIRMVGNITYDETRQSYITAWVPGRLDKLYADYTGIMVNKGDSMVYLYSPELLAAQQELLQAKEAVTTLNRSTSTTLKTTAQASLTASREKLRLYGLTETQIAEIESNGIVSDHLVIFAPVGGVVIEKNAQEGMYVKTGTRIYTIAELRTLWVMFDAFESDLLWLKNGQRVEFTTKSFPGEIFEATISFIDPVVDPKTRTVRVRAIVNNKDMRLKPDMFVRGFAKSYIDNNDSVISEKQVVQSGSKSNAPLLIPTSAPLITGKRAVVYVQLPESDEGVLFEGREVVLGPRAGDYYIVKSGLEEGEQVVTNGAFKIDSELQIKAKPSMMSPTGEGAMAGHQHGQAAATGTSTQPEHTDMTAGKKLKESAEAVQALTPIYNAFFNVQMALASDDLQAAKKAANVLREQTGKVDMTLFSSSGHMQWMKLSDKLSDYSSSVAKSDDIETARKGFYNLAKTIVTLHNTFGHSDAKNYYLTFCPMANDNKGAYWLQTVDTVYNSFYGEMMLRCGEIKDTLPSISEKAGE